MILKDIPGYEGLYAISRDGRVYSYRFSRFFNLNRKNNWYVQVRLCKDKIQTPIRVHTLVAAAFLHKPDHCTEVNHKNGIKTDNRVENLEWVCRSENIKHSYSVLGRIPVTGANHPKHRLILDLQTGIYYDSSTEAAYAKGISKAKLLNSMRKTKYKTRRAPYRYGLVFV